MSWYCCKQFGLVALVFILVLGGLSVNNAIADEQWCSVRYINSFIFSHLPSEEAIFKMGPEGFFTLWGVLAFLETNLPAEGSGIYLATLRNLKQKIRLFKNDMLYLAFDIGRIRKIDRRIVSAQVREVYLDLFNILNDFVRLRNSLLKPSMFIFRSGLGFFTGQSTDLKFSLSLNHLNPHSLFKAWTTSRHREIEWEIVKQLHLDLVQLKVNLDPFRDGKTKQIDSFIELKKQMRNQNIDIYITTEFFSDYYELDLTMSPRSGRPLGKVNSVTLRSQALKAIRILLREIQPEYLGVGNFSHTVAESLNRPVERSFWLDLFAEIVKLRDQESSGTAIVFELDPSNDGDYKLAEAIAEQNLNSVVIGFQVYNLSDFMNINRFMGKYPAVDYGLSQFWDTYGLYIDSLTEDFLSLGCDYAMIKKMKFINVSSPLNFYNDRYGYTPIYYVFRDIVLRSFFRSSNLAGIRYRAFNLDYEAELYLKGTVKQLSGGKISIADQYFKED